jgi:hypothetical protein
MDINPESGIPGATEQIWEDSHIRPIATQTPGVPGSQ